MILKEQLPKTKDVNKCCGKPTIVGKMRVRTRMMSNPPRPADKYVHILHWQCVTNEKHNGEIWETSDKA